MVFLTDEKSSRSIHYIALDTSVNDRNSECFQEKLTTWEYLHSPSRISRPQNRRYKTSKNNEIYAKKKITIIKNIYLRWYVLIFVNDGKKISKNKNVYEMN